MTERYRAESAPHEARTKIPDDGFDFGKLGHCRPKAIRRLARRVRRAGSQGLTVIVPTMVGWMPQWYVIVACGRERDLYEWRCRPGCRTGEVAGVVGHDVVGVGGALRVVAAGDVTVDPADGHAGGCHPATRTSGFGLKAVVVRVDAPSVDVDIGGWDGAAVDCCSGPDSDRRCRRRRRRRPAAAVPVRPGEERVTTSALALRDPRNFGRPGRSGTTVTARRARSCGTARRRAPRTWQGETPHEYDDSAFEPAQQRRGAGDEVRSGSAGAPAGFLPPALLPPPDVTAELLAGEVDPRGCVGRSSCWASAKAGRGRGHGEYPPAGHAERAARRPAPCRHGRR